MRSGNRPAFTRQIGEEHGVDQTVPYCGPAPLPEHLWYAWNFDPFAIALVLALSGVVGACVERNVAFRTSFLTLVTGAVVFISPLCALTTALFFARIFHHFLLMALLAPLVAHALLHRWPTVFRRLPAEAVFIIHTTIFWFWHLPPGYAFALSGTYAYWLMQGALLISAVWLWCFMLSSQTTVFSAVALSLGTAAQMGMLAAILTLSPQPLFSAHFFTTQPFGIEPLTDQQIAGTVMWTIGIFPYLLVALLRLFQTFSNADLRSGR